MYPEHTASLGAAPPITPTPTPSHWGIITAGDVQAEQARTLASAQATDLAVQQCAQLDPEVKSAWSVFYAGLVKWCQTPVVNFWTPWMPDGAIVVSGDTGNTMMAYEAELQGWQQKINGTCQNAPPGLSTFNPQPSPDQSTTTQMFRYAAIIAGFLGTAYVVGKAAEFIPKPSGHSPPERPAPARERDSYRRMMQKHRAPSLAAAR